MQYDGDDKGGDVGIPKYVLYDGVDTLDEAYDAPEDKEEQGDTTHRLNAPSGELSACTPSWSVSLMMASSSDFSSSFMVSCF